MPRPSAAATHAATRTKGVLVRTPLLRKRPTRVFAPTPRHHAIFGSLPQLLRLHDELETTLAMAPTSEEGPLGAPSAAAAGGGDALGRGVALCRAFLAVSDLEPKPEPQPFSEPKPEPQPQPQPNPRSYVT